MTVFGVSTAAEPPPALALPAAAGSDPVVVKIGPIDVVTCTTPWLNSVFAGVVPVAAVVLSDWNGRNDAVVRSSAFAVSTAIVADRRAGAAAGAGTSGSIVGAVTIGRSPVGAAGALPMCGAGAFWSPASRLVFHPGPLRGWRRRLPLGFRCRRRRRAGAALPE